MASTYVTRAQEVSCRSLDLQWAAGGTWAEARHAREDKAGADQRTRTRDSVVWKSGRDSAADEEEKGGSEKTRPDETRRDQTRFNSHQYRRNRIVVECGRTSYLIRVAKDREATGSHKRIRHKAQRTQATTGGRTSPYDGRHDHRCTVG